MMKVSPLEITVRFCKHNDENVLTYETVLRAV